MSVQRVLRNTQATLEVTFYSGGVAADADGAVTVDITRADGTAFATGAATTKPPATTGIYRYTLAPQADLEYFTLVWQGAFGAVTQKITTHAEVAGAFYVPLADIRALDGLTSATTFPNAKLDEARQWFEDLAEDYCERAFVPRYAREVLDGTGADTILLSHIRLRKLLSVKVGGTAQTGLGTWDLYESGKVIRDTGTFTKDKRNVEITYEHGDDEPPYEIRQAALTAIRARLLGDKSGIPERAFSMQVEGASFGLSIAGDRRPTGIPVVDQVLMRYSDKLPLVG